MKRLYETEEETAPMVEVPAPMVEVPAPMVEVPAPMVEVPAPMVEVPMVEVPMVEVPMPEEKVAIDADTMSTEDLWRVWHIVKRNLPKLQMQRLSKRLWRAGFSLVKPTTDPKVLRNRANTLKRYHERKTTTTTVRRSVYDPRTGVKTTTSSSE